LEARKCSQDYRSQLLKLRVEKDYYTELTEEARSNLDLEPATDYWSVRKPLVEWYEAEAAGGPGAYEAEDTQYEEAVDFSSLTYDQQKLYYDDHLAFRKECKGAVGDAAAQCEAAARADVLGKRTDTGYYTDMTAAERD